MLVKNPDMETDVWQNISPSAKSLIKSMIAKDVKKRARAEEALHHEWFTKTQAEEHIHVDPEILNAMKKYQAKTQLQKEAMYVLANYLDLDELKELRDIFHQLDVSHTGEISYEDLE